MSREPTVILQKFIPENGQRAGSGASGLGGWQGSWGSQGSRVQFKWFG